MRLVSAAIALASVAVVFGEEPKTYDATGPVVAVNREKGTVVIKHNNRGIVKEKTFTFTEDTLIEIRGEAVKAAAIEKGLTITVTCAVGTRAADAISITNEKYKTKDDLEREAKKREEAAERRKADQAKIAEAKPLRISKIEVDQIGTLPKGWVIDEIINSNDFMMIRNPSESPSRLYVSGVPTKGLADGKQLDWPTKVFKVSGPVGSFGSKDKHYCLDYIGEREPEPAKKKDKK